MSPTSTSPPRVPAFDGLRAIAVGLVLVQHGLCRTLNFLVWPGPVGVRLFFVLSGFLITGVLMHAREQDSAVWPVWRAFLVRRALRLFPLAYLAMLVAWLLGGSAMTAHGWWYVTYLGNVQWWLHGPAAGNELGHFWSLAIEEQFYLAWPALMLLVPRRLWSPIMIGTCVVAVATRILHYELEGALPTYALTWCRMDALAFGGLIAERRPRVADLLLLAGGLTAASQLVGGRDSVMFTLLESALVVGSGAVILAVSQGWLRPVLSCRPMVYLGSLSYGIYVWGGMMPTLLLPALERVTGFSILSSETGWWPLLVTTASTLLVALLSWRVVERPFNDLKRFVPSVPVPTRPRASAFGRVRDQQAAPLGVALR